jgi:hypothetical protein
MVSVVKDPTGHKIIDQSIEATITDASGDALITFPYHGLGTGDYVYIDSDLDEYNGFWHVTAIDTDTFKISEYPTADFVAYFQDADIEYYHTEPHVWNAIYLPIVYKLANTLWPVNTEDTVRNVTALGDDNGYMEVTASGTVKAGIKALDYVKISGNADEDLNGVFQIIEVISATHFVLDLAYSSIAISGATIQYYYNNYQAKVKVYAGLPAGHPWESKKPMEELAELSFTPDENNLVMFSISDYIRGKVEIKNNPTLYSMPLNLDAFTGFYISIAESYDGSDGYTVTTEESAFVEDTFEGYAITGKLPFKNTYAGDYAQYVYVSGAPASWLTLMDRLIAVEDKYFDISFIKNVSGDFIVSIDKYVSDYLTTTETIAYTDQGIGVYRIPITTNADYDSFCVTIRTNPTLSSITPPALSTWQTRSTTVDLIDWTTGASPSVSLSGGIATSELSEYLYFNYSFIKDYQYTITVSYTSTSGGFGRSMLLAVTDDSFTTIDSNVETTTAGAQSIVLTFTATDDTTKIILRASVAAQLAMDIEITSATGTVLAPDVSLTEEICIDMIESCEAVSGFTPTDIRLLEDGSYRILE